MLSLLKAIDNKQFVGLHIESQAELIQCMVIGGDLVEGSLLLDEPYPCFTQTQRLSIEQDGLWLQLAVEDTHLILRVSIKRFVGRGLLVDVLSYHYSANKRWFPRVHFHAHKGPKLSIRPDYSPQLEATLKNLSVYGGAFDIWNKDLRKEFKLSRTYEPCIRFNEQFQLGSKIKILECKFARSPCSHTQVRFRFSDLSIIEKQQLSNFIESSNRRVVAA